MLFRVVVVMTSAIVVMLTTVALRAEARRHEFLTAQHDWEARLLRQELREKEYELARLTDPDEIRKHVAGRRLEEEIRESSAAAPARKTP